MVLPSIPAIRRLIIARPWRVKDHAEFIAVHSMGFVSSLQRLCSLPLWKQPCVGRRGERVARRFLKKQGFAILQTNWRCNTGEIDIVAVRGNTLHFIEVKTRSALLPLDLSPTQAIDHRKEEKLISLSDIYLRRYGTICRRRGISKACIDLVSVLYLVDTLTGRSAFCVRRYAISALRSAWVSPCYPPQP